MTNEELEFEDKAVLKILAALIASPGSRGPVDARVTRAYEYVDELMKQRKARRGTSPFTTTTIGPAKQPK